jgi:hypothetical protein
MHRSLADLCPVLNQEPSLIFTVTAWQYGWFGYEVQQGNCVTRDPVLESGGNANSLILFWLKTSDNCLWTVFTATILRLTSTKLVAGLVPTLFGDTSRFLLAFAFLFRRVQNLIFSLFKMTHRGLLCQKLDRTWSDLFRPEKTTSDKWSSQVRFSTSEKKTFSCGVRAHFYPFWQPKVFQIFWIQEEKCIQDQSSDK